MCDLSAKVKVHQSNNYYGRFAERKESPIEIGLSDIASIHL